MKHRIWLVISIFTLGLLAGCASSEHGRSIDDPTNSLVFGYIDMDDAPTGVNSAWIRQVAPVVEKPYWGRREGRSFLYSLPPPRFVSDVFFQRLGLFRR